MIGFIIAIIFKDIFSNLERFIALKQSAKVSNKYRNSILSLVMDKNYVSFNKYSYGDVETIMTSCIEDINDTTYCFFETLFVFPIGIIIGLTYIFNISYLLVILLINGIIMSKGVASQEEASKRIIKSQSRYFSFISSVYNAYENIRFIFIRSKVNEKHIKESTSFANSEMNMAKISSINIQMAIDITESIFRIAIIFIFYKLIKSGSNTVGGYIAF